MIFYVTRIVALCSPHRSLGAPIVGHLRQPEQQNPGRRLVVLIPELEPMRAWPTTWSSAGSASPSTWSAN